MPSSEDVMILFEGVDNVSSVASGISNEINNLGSNANVSGNSITSKISEAASSFGTLNGILASTVGVLAGKSLSDLIVGNAETKEVNKVLLSGMADTEDGVNSLFNTIDEATNQSLVSMNQLVPALKSFSAETGLSGSELESVVPQFAQFESYMTAMTGSSDIAYTAMTKISNGLNSSSQFLKRYGFSQEVLKENGWSGQEDDVTGYMNALTKAMGDTDALMNTTTGGIKKLNKAFSSAGGEIGKSILPVINGVATGLVGLNKWSGKTLFKSFLIAASGLDILITGLGQVTVLVKGVESIFQALKAFGAVGDAVKSKVTGVDKLSQKASKDSEIKSNSEVSLSNKELTNSNLGLVSSNAELGTSFEALNTIKKSTSSVNTSLIGENEALIASNQALAESNATAGVTGNVDDVLDLTDTELNSASSHANTVPVTKAQGVSTNLGSLEGETSQIEKNTSSVLKNSTAKNGLKGAESALAAGGVEAVGTVGAEGEALAGAGASAGVFGSGIMATLGPLLAIVAIIAIVVVSVYELGKAFGWWSDVGSMIDSIKSGLQRLWSAFTGSSAVQGVIKTLQSGFQTLKNIITTVGTVVNTVFSEVFGYMGSSDPVQNLINSFGKLQPLINSISQAFQAGFSFINSVLASFLDQWNTFANSDSGQELFASLRQAFQAVGQAWNQLQPAISQIVNAFGQLFSAVTGKSTGGSGASNIASIMVQVLVLALKGAVVVIHTFASAIQVLATVIHVVAGVITSLAGAINWLRGAFGNIASSLQDAGEMIANFPKYLASLPGKIGQFITTSLQKIQQFTSKMKTYAMKAGHDFLNGIINNIKTLPGKLWNTLLKTIQKILQFDTKSKIQAMKIGMNIVNGVINWIKQLPIKIGQWFTSTVTRISSFTSQALINAGQVGMSAVNGVINWVKTLPGKVYNEFIKIGQKIHDSVSSAVSAATSFGSDIVNAVMGALHIASPGIIQRSIAKEFADIPLRISESNSAAEIKSKSFAESIKHGFGIPKLKLKTALEYKSNTPETLSDYQKHLQNQLKLKTQAVNLAAGGVKTIGGTQIVQKHVHLSKGAVPIDARNMTQREAEKVVISALEQWGNTSPSSKN